MAVWILPKSCSILFREGNIAYDSIDARWAGASSRSLCFFRSFLKNHSNFGVPITVQQVCIPQAIVAQDIICQAKSGLGKTAVFVLATLQRLELVPGETSVVVMCHTRELAYQIKNEYNRFSKYLPEVKTAVFFGGVPMSQDIETLSSEKTHPHIIVATPGRLHALVREKKLRLANVQMFVLDECDRMLDQVGMLSVYLSRVDIY